MKYPFILLLAIVLFGCSQEDDTRPNILFIMMDDLGYGQLGINNDSLQTRDFDPLFVHFVDSTQDYAPEQALALSKMAIPTMTKLAKEGIIFRKAYASSNLCAPSRIGIATGILQNRFGIYANADGEENGFPQGSHLAEKFQDAGYRTAHIGKWHIGKRDKTILQTILTQHGLPKETAYHELALHHPEVFQEVEKTGYYGSVIDDHHPLNNGFDYYYGYNTWASQFYHSTLVWENFEHAGKQIGYNTDVFTEKGIDFIKQHKKDGAPFFLQLHYHAVHDSLEPKAPELYLSRFKSPSHDLNNFYAHIYGVDENIKRIIDYLKSNDLYENTLIIFTSDNGAMAGGRHKGNKIGSPLPGNAPFAGHKGNFHQGGIRVPMFMHWPNGIKKSFVSNHLVSTMDILPTALDAAEEEIPKNIDGKSLIPLLKNPKYPAIHDYLLWAGMHSAAWGFLIEKTSKDHHSERPFAPASWVIINDDYLLRFIGRTLPGIYSEYPEGKKTTLELFEIDSDPSETKDLSVHMPGKVEQLSKQFHDEFSEFPPPVVWEKEKWDEIKNSKLLVLP